ncbi:MAG: hypothetical protein WDO74_37490 [Pseudomonadota bacterium]
MQRNASSETKAYLNTLKQIEDKDCVQVCTAIRLPFAEQRPMSDVGQ